MGQCGNEGFIAPLPHLLGPLPRRCHGYARINPTIAHGWGSPATIRVYHAPLEPTSSDLQAQIDRLSLTVQMGRDSKSPLEPATQQLSRLAERCNEILNRWNEADGLHAHVVNEAALRLNEWSAIESRLEHDYTARLAKLEQIIEQEWQSLRQIHEEPVKQLRLEAAALGEVCVSAANLAIQGFERAEARLNALETNIQDRLTQLSQDVQMAIADGRREPELSELPGATVAPFPLEGVMRIHDDLRESSPDAMAGSHALAPRDRSDNAIALTARMESLEREVTSERQEVRENATRSESMRRTGRLALIALGIVLLVDALVGVIMQRNLNARLDDAASRVAAAEKRAEAASTVANQQIAAARADGDRQIAQARQAAAEAGIVANVLAAPDLIRFNLAGTDRAPRAYAQVLWSRSRGLVLSVSQLPQLAEGAIYQVWLNSDGGPVSAGTVTPDASGRAMLAVESPQNLPRGVSGVSVTSESGGVQSAPSANTVLSRVQQ